MEIEITKKRMQGLCAIKDLVDNFDYQLKNFVSSENGEECFMFVHDLERGIKDTLRAISEEVHKCTNISIDKEGRVSASLKYSYTI